MSKPILYSIVESPVHPRCSDVYRRMGFEEIIHSSQRKAISQLKKDVPDVVVCEFFYGYGNNYAGVNISNLDVFLLSLKKYKADTTVIVLADKTERQYVDALNETYPLHSILVHPVRCDQIETSLKSLSL